MRSALHFVVLGCIALAGCSKPDPTGSYKEELEGKIAANWRFKSDGTVQRLLRLDKGAVAIPGRWKLSGDKLAVEFEQQHVQRRLAPGEFLEFEITKNGDLIGVFLVDGNPPLKLIKRSKVAGENSPSASTGKD